MLLTAIALLGVNAIPVTHMQFDPAADGALSAAEADVPLQRFGQEFRFDNPEVERAELAFRLGYTETHLYLAITTDRPVTYHPRGDLWGDGYRILLARSENGEASPQYRDIYVDPRPPDDEGVEIFTAAVDGVQVFTKLSDDSAVAEASHEFGSVFEAMIAFSDIEPFDPVWAEPIGLNLYFAKAYRTEAEGHFPYGNALVADEGIWDEVILQRASVPLSFEVPKDTVGWAKLSPGSLHLREGEDIIIERGDVGRVSRRTSYEWTLTDTGGSQIREGRARLNRGQSVPLKGTRTVQEGLYSLELTAASTTRSFPVAIFPREFGGDLPNKIDTNALSAGSVTSLQFHLNTLEEKFNAIADYSDPTGLFERWQLLKEDLEIASAGRDPFEGRKGPYRRAFRSAIDDTLQPYSVRLPQSYDEDEPRPAIVFLHGSGQDEQSILNAERGNGELIQIAPFGRDKFEAYASTNSQTDIVEALDAATEDFAIDRERIIIGGFSMGGYGALRAFYESPDLYRGVAVFAGNPDLANEWLGSEHPNFLDPGTLAVFEDVPVFIYQGRQDASLSVEPILEMAKAMEKAGAKVTLSISEENGHEYQDDATQKRYEGGLPTFSPMIGRPDRTNWPSQS
ncbi:MAG: prolyl oligopeptidase family serine peptidase [Parvularcula sp.]|nr:prolyl oligopeptidase family serine peptidase [Parvularcula sp.]